MIGHDELVQLDLCLELCADVLDFTVHPTPEQRLELAAQVCKARSFVHEALDAYRDEEVTS